MHLRVSGRLARALAVVGLSLATVLVGATARADAQTTRTVIHIPAMVLDNLCNGEPVAVSGDLYITTSTTVRSDGGVIVRSSSVAPNLEGTGLVTRYPYTGSDGENSFAYYAPPPFPSTFQVGHWTVLVPRGPAPSMYLVIVLRETIGLDGVAVPTLERMYLTCRQPTCWSRHSD